MNSNGQTRNNNFVGDVYIDGNLNVTGNINGGGGGGGNVNNPMTEDLDVNQFSIHNVSEITGYEGVLRTNQLDLQDTEIININELKGNSNENKLYISANVEILENLDMTDKSIININELKCSTGSEIKTSLLNLQNNNIIGVNSVHLNLLEGIANTISLFGDIKIITSLNLLGNVISNVGSLTAYSPTAHLNLDFIPTTAGTANQVLSRDSKYNPSNPNTHKLVWADPGSGFVTNPLSIDLSGDFKNINLVNTIKARELKPSDNNGLVIDSKTPTNVDSKITISTPTLTINNSTNLAPTAIGITGNIHFTNAAASLTAPTGLSIKAGYIYNDEAPINVQTQTFFLGGVHTNNIGLNFGYDLNIVAPKTYLNGRLSNFFSDAKMGTRNVRTSLYKSFGNNTLINDFNSLTPVPIDSINGPTIGIPVLIANTMNTGDKIKITMNTSLSTSAGGNMTWYVYMGTTYANRKLQTSFLMPNSTTNDTITIVEIELDTIIVNDVMKFDKVALMSIIKSNNVAPRMILGSSTTVINQISPLVDNYIYVFASVSTILGEANILILGETIEHY